MLPLLLILMVGCSSKKAEVDYDPSFEVIALATFTIVHESLDGYDSLNENRIKEAIVDEMQRKGYKNTGKDRADFYVRYKNSIKEDVPSKSSFGFGLGTFSSGLGLSLGAVSRSSNDKSIMIINMLDPKTKNVFWSSSFTHNIDRSKTPKESTEFFNKTIATMLKDFPAKSMKEHE